MTLRAVVFDIGETIVDETRAWSSWADWLGIPRMTFLAVCGAVIARGELDHREPLRIFRPGIDLREERRRRAEAGVSDDVIAADLYPDAVACLRAIHDAGYRIGLAGNQPARTETVLAELGLPLDLLASSESLGVQKPDPRFFAKIAEALDLPPAEIAYVGDRLDNDVRPAAAAGLQAIFIRRGAWAWIQQPSGSPPEAALTVESLAELPAAIAARWPGA
ncbi:MAG TPA: HAD family hydrolase [Candidatus Limnocylindrales bacterium]|nr:HAD family hydrolase [Candidatus Limnocylindrales bacterium]